jgi:hypothetical protein
MYALTKKLYTKFLRFPRVPNTTKANVKVPPSLTDG